MIAGVIENMSLTITLANITSFKLVEIQLALTHSKNIQNRHITSDSLSKLHYMANHTHSFVTYVYENIYTLENHTAQSH